MSESRSFPVLTAAGSGREIDVARLGVPAVLLCYAEPTQSQGEQIENAIRERYPDASAVIVGHVIDLHSVPGIFRGVAEGVIKGEYEKAVRSLAPGQEAYDHVIILPDWDGAFIAAAGLSDVDKQAGVAVFAADGWLVGTAQGDDAASEALRLLDQHA